MEPHSPIWEYLKPDARKKSKSGCVLLVLLCFVLIHFQANGQAGIPPLKKITLNDKVLERVLRNYLRESQAKVVAVFIERYDDDYTYTLHDFGLFDTVKRNSTIGFGEWNKSILLF